MKAKFLAVAIVFGALLPLLLVHKLYIKNQKISATVLHRE